MCWKGLISCYKSTSQTTFSSNEHMLWCNLTNSSSLLSNRTLVILILAVIPPPSTWNLGVCNGTGVDLQWIIDWIIRSVSSRHTNKNSLLLRPCQTRYKHYFAIKILQNNKRIIGHKLFRKLTRWKCSMKQQNLLQLVIEISFQLI